MDKNRYYDNTIETSGQSNIKNQCIHHEDIQLINMKQHFTKISKNIVPMIRGTKQHFTMYYKDFKIT